MNPLLDIQFRIPFDEIRAEHVQPAIETLLAEARQRQKRLAESDGSRTFDNTVLELEGLGEKLGRAMGVISHLEAVATYPALRDAFNAVQPLVSLFSTELTLDPGLYRALKAYAETDEARNLTGPRARLLRKTLDAFRRNGAELDEPGKERLKQIDVELTELTTRFSQNVVDATAAFDLLIQDAAQLAGLPPSAIDAAHESARAKGLEGWRFTLQAPSLTAVLTYMDDAAVRETMYRAHISRATAEPHDNSALLSRILRLRRERANLLGYANFADLVLEDRMAHTGAAAREFVEQLRLRTEDRFRQETEELTEFRRELEGSGAAPLQPWDVGYYAEKLRAKVYDFDEEALRPYFPLERVLSGMFRLIERLYGVAIVQESGVPGWDAAVSYYKILEPDGSNAGSFYTDWYPRENKRGGAWMDAFITGYRAPDGTFLPHLGLMCGNLTPPVADRPSLLTHREAETVFHEFGHLLHQCLSKVELRGLAGTNVAWDFVELPSQIMENWCWERESLDLFARHYLTDKPLPEDLFQKMKRARTFRAASGQMRQLGFGALDLDLHINYDEAKDGDVLTYSRNLSQPYASAPLPERYGMIAGFTHLFASPVAYAAGYYSYKWAEVLDADAFTRFQKEGIFSREVGRAFHDCILSRGDSEDPAELFRCFMGRDPDPS
ncbi:MAG TPA: M3 family metallopeptidase, partial [Bryobacteraceae bacterium]|nr:M3 family metallopeptidase [Bryobacteraceae bacterium]